MRRLLIPRRCTIVLVVIAFVCYFAYRNWRMWVILPAGTLSMCVVLPAGTFCLPELTFAYYFAYRNWRLLLTSEFFSRSITSIWVQTRSSAETKYSRWPCTRLIAWSCDGATWSWIVTRNSLKPWSDEKHRCVGGNSVSSMLSLTWIDKSVLSRTVKS